MLILNVFILLHIIPVISVYMKIYDTAWFQPINTDNHIVALLSIPTINACACQCILNDLCVTGTFFGNNQTCVLFSSHLSQGKVNIIHDTLVKVYSFLEPPSMLSEYIRV